jgi:mannose-6-phosphate isomerase-like protein (cupin superfamily)
MSDNKKKKKSPMPEWVGNQPFPPEKKRPCLIPRDLEIPQIFGVKGDPNIIFSELYFSTDRIVLAEFTVPPGGRFGVPDIHAGDETYYCREGNGIVFDPESGDVIEMKKGDALLIPKGTRHQAFNFTAKPFVVVCAIAPQGWADDDGMGTAISYSGPYRVFKDESDEKR